MGMRDRFKEGLLNPTWEQIVERNPIIAFSFYLCGRVHVLLAVADEIIENLDQAFRDKVVDGGRVERAESLMWFVDAWGVRSRMDNVSGKELFL